jgi:predicted negative regulator of RcsB-dependent stress response
MIMKRIIIILIVVAVGGYFAYAYFQGEAKKKIARTEARQKKVEQREARHAVFA